jgi:predicted ATPase/DNA-binding CsgD family transcriptional regulator
VDVVSRLLQARETRLLTLLGPGGVGKTRLALEIARHLLPCFPDGMFFVPLASLRDPHLLLSHLARTLELDEHSALEPAALLKTHMNHASVLLLLDTFEHLLTAAPLLLDLLYACPSLKILVTSQALLRVQGELVFEVLPFPLPGPEHTTTTEDLLRAPAVQLFVERARVLSTTFRLTALNSRAIVEICTRLDGLPLAIELAAARSNLLPPRTLLRLLQSRLSLLTTRGPDVDWRQQTLRNTLQWSYDLLTAEEQSLFRALCVFTGGSTLEAIEAVIDRDLDVREHLVERIASLRDKSFVYSDEQENGELRLRMLETIREYGLVCLQASGEAEHRERLHAEYFLALAEEAAANLNGREQKAWLERLEHEHANLRAALNWLIQTEQTALALRFVSALSLFWTMHNHMNEGYHWVEKALANSADAPVSLRARALFAAGSFCFYRGENSRAAILLEDSLSLCRELGDKQGMAFALNGLGHVALAQHRYSLVRQVSEENLHLAHELGDRWKMAEALFLLAYGYLDQGAYDRGRAAGEESLALAREFSEPRCLAHSILAVGRIALKQHDLEAASAFYQESLSLGLQINDQWLITACLVGLGEGVAEQGKPAWAARLWGAEEALHQTIQTRREYLVRTPEEGFVRTARAALGEEAFAAAWAQGCHMTVKQALAYGNEEPVVATRPSLFAVPSPASSSQGARKEQPAQAAGLTAREVEVLRLIALGLTNPQIARRLVVSPVTVNTHVRSIYSKLGISSRSAATRYVLEHPLPPERAQDLSQTTL